MYSDFWQNEQGDFYFRWQLLLSEIKSLVQVTFSYVLLCY